MLRLSLKSISSFSPVVSRPSVLSSIQFSSSTSSASDAEQLTATIESKLTEALSPSVLQVVDISGGCGTSFAVQIESSAFCGLPLIKQHRLVNETIAEEIAGIHALQLSTKAVNCE